MKTKLTTSLFCFFLLSNQAICQDVIKQIPCDNPFLKNQADSIIDEYTTRGFTLLRQASVTMESQYEMPIILPMMEGSWYFFAFLADPTSRINEVRMFDWNEKQVIYQKNYGSDKNGHINTFSYIPKFTEHYMIKPVQVNKQKKKGLCGYVVLMKRTQDAPERKN